MQKDEILRSFNRALLLCASQEWQNDEANKECMGCLAQIIATGDRVCCHFFWIFWPEKFLSYLQNPQKKGPFLSVI